MSIEELATLLGEQMCEAQAKAWDEGHGAGMRDAFYFAPDTCNPYRKVSA